MKTPPCGVPPTRAEYQTAALRRKVAKFGRKTKRTRLRLRRCRAREGILNPHQHQLLRAGRPRMDEARALRLRQVEDSRLEDAVFLLADRPRRPLGLLVDRAEDFG